MAENQKLDRIFIRDLLVRGIIGVNPHERENSQNILINVVLWADTRVSGASDDLADTVSYSTLAKAIIRHVKSTQPFLVERLASDLAAICIGADSRIAAVEITVEKPGAVRFTKSVGVTIYRTRADLALLGNKVTGDS